MESSDCKIPKTNSTTTSQSQFETDFWSQSAIPQPNAAFFVLQEGAPSKPADSAPAGSRVLGIAVCWEADRCFYLPAPAAGASAEGLWAPVRAALQEGSARKITYDLKPQLAGLARGGGPAGGVLIADPLVDVRIAAWLLNPDAKEVLIPHTPNLQAKQNTTAHTLIAFGYVLQQVYGFIFFIRQLPLVPAPVPKKLFGDEAKSCALAPDCNNIHSPVPAQWLPSNLRPSYGMTPVILLAVGDRQPGAAACQGGNPPQPGGSSGDPPGAGAGGGDPRCPAGGRGRSCFCLLCRPRPPQMLPPRPAVLHALRPFPGAPPGEPRVGPVLVLELRP